MNNLNDKRQECRLAIESVCSQLFTLIKEQQQQQQTTTINNNNNLIECHNHPIQQQIMNDEMLMSDDCSESLTTSGNSNGDNALDLVGAKRILLSHNKKSIDLPVRERNLEIQTNEATLANLTRELQNLEKKLAQQMDIQQECQSRLQEQEHHRNTAAHSLMAVELDESAALKHALRTNADAHKTRPFGLQFGLFTRPCAADLFHTAERARQKHQKQTRRATRYRQKLSTATNEYNKVLDEYQKIEIETSAITAHMDALQMQANRLRQQLEGLRQELEDRMQLADQLQTGTKQIDKVMAYLMTNDRQNIDMNTSGECVTDTVKQLMLLVNSM